MAIITRTSLALFVSVLIPVLSFAQGNNSGNSFGHAKKILFNRIYANHNVTFYAGCKYDKKKKIKWETCGFVPRKKSKRAERLEWEHVMPAWELGHQLQCWQSGGRKACRKNKVYRRMASDMHNLRPSIGQLNEDRRNYRYGMVEGEKRVYGHNIDFEVDFKHRVAEPKPSVRGDVARTYFYMEKEYKLKIGKKQRRLFNAWSKQDPVDSWEAERNCRIAATQGNINSFIGDCY